MPVKSNDMPQNDDSAKMTDNFIKSVSVDAEEMQQFAAMANDWWNVEGKFKPLHQMNACRTGLIKSEICEHFNRDPNDARPLEGLRIVDIGCGGGLLAEPLTRLGAKVTGVDALEPTVKAAKTHAKEMGLDIEYIFGTAEGLVASGVQPYDVVTALEIVEHVVDPAKFLQDCALLVRPGGQMFVSTINRTAKAFWLAIFGAEYVMRWLPVGTHQYDKFITPQELSLMLNNAGLVPGPAIGMSYNPLTQNWKTGRNTGANYIISATKP